MKVNELKVGSILSLLSIGIGMLIQIFYTPFYMSHLGASDYGINSLVQSIMGYMGMLNLGLGNAMLRYTVRYRAEGKIEEEKSLNGMFILIFSIIMFISILIGFYIYINIPNFFGEKFTIDELSKTRKVFVIMLLNVAVSFPAGVFSTNISSKEKFLYQRGLGLITMILNPLIGGYLMLRGYGLVAITCSTVFFALFSSGFNVIYAIQLGMRVKFTEFNWMILKEIVSYSFFIFLNIVIDRIYWGTDRIIIGRYIGTTAVGIYAIGAIFNNIYISFSTAVSGVLFPKVNRMIVEGKDKELSDFFIKIGRLQYILLGLISSGFILFGKDFIRFWLGEGYVEAYTIAIWTMIPLTVPLIQNLGIAIVQAKNKHQFRSVVYFFIALINVVTSIFLVKKYGSVGCAIATGISFIIGNIIVMNIYYYKKINLDIPLFWKNILKMSCPIGVTMIFGILLNTYSPALTIMNYSLKIILYIVVYAGGLWFFGMNEYEKNQILSPFLKLKTKIMI